MELVVEILDLEDELLYYFGMVLREAYVVERHTLQIMKWSLQQ